MERLRLVGLADEGPGDIVGAICGETDVGNDRIGAIEIDGDVAEVEVDPGVAEQVRQALDGAEVGTSEVRVYDADDPVVGYVAEMSDLVELEREEEMRRHEAEMRELSGPEREARGRALTGMRGFDKGEGLGGHLVRFLKSTRDQPLPDLEIAVGDLVRVSKKDPLRDDNPTGTVAKKTPYSLMVAFDSPPADWLTSTGLRVDLYVNDIVYQRMLSALDRLPDAEGPLAELADVVVGEQAPSAPGEADVDVFDDDLDASQRRAVRRAVDADRIHLVHGPPGTGKTTTAIEVIRQAVDRGRSVLATAASNTAVDNLLEFLVDRGVDAVRVGHPARVSPRMRAHTLDRRVEDHPDWQEAERLRQRGLDLKDRQEELTYPSGRWRRGMSDQRIKQLAGQGGTARGVPPERIEEMAEWLEIQDEVEEVFERVDALEDGAIDDVLDDADVVCTTNASSGGSFLSGRSFDLLVLDEATQATAPSCWIPMVRADKVVLAGDHRQLPPTVKSREAERGGLSRTLFESVAERHDETVDLLRRQYRMHEAIMGFSDASFYDGKLEADPSVAGHTLAGLGVDRDDLDHADVLDPREPVVFVDTGGDMPERQRQGSHSRENPGEAEVVAGLARDLLEAGLAPEDVAVISPYHDQVDRIQGMLDVDDLEVDTVDGFQGREKESVLISLVRSNAGGEIGFLEDLRRLNVALTRARRKLVVVGDAGTVGGHRTYADLVDYVRDRGRVVEAPPPEHF